LEALEYNTGAYCDVFRGNGRYLIIGAIRSESRYGKDGGSGTDELNTDEVPVRGSNMTRWASDCQDES
jgi:hypothetical protein